MHPTPPLVSCLLLTADRRRFVPQAIRLFLAQDYPHRELIVLDDGSDAVEDLVPRDAGIRYVRLPQRETIGVKRNLGCEQAAGELIAHWDDDDWMAPWRLSYQVEELLRYQADVCGLRQIYFWGPDRDRAWLYTYPAEEPPWVAGGTMLYRREFWRRNPFVPVSVGEDNLFVWSETPKRVLPLADRGFYVAAIHPGNTSPKTTMSERWAPAPLEEVRQLIGAEWEHQAAVTFGPAAPPWRAPLVQPPGETPEGPVPPFTLARAAHLDLPEFAALHRSRSLPWMRRWELPFALFQARLTDTMAVLDCSINPAGLSECIAELYPHILYRHASPIDASGFQPPAGVPDEAFDRVIAINTVEHLLRPQREQLMAALAAKLKPGGWLIVTKDCYFDSAWTNPNWLKTGLLRADHEEVFNGFNRLGAGELEDLCARHGLISLSPAPPEPEEGDAALYLNQPDLVHTVLGAVFSKGPYREPSGRRILLGLLTWNTRQVSLDSLAAYIREARMLERLGHRVEIAVVDNGSDDGTAEELRKLDACLDLPHRFVYNPENVGNSRARNQIIDHMLASGADYLMFLDGDIEVVPFSTFVMLRHMESSGGSLGCLGAHSFGCTPDRERATPTLYSLAGCQLHSSDLLAWTQYGLFRRRVFEEGVRFEERGPFGEPGHGLEDVDLAFQMHQRGYRNHYFSGMCYLHRNLSSSVGILSAQHLEPTERYYRRKEFLLRKWESVPQISEGPLNWVRHAQAPWIESRAGQNGMVRMAPSAEPIEVPGAVLEWVDRSVSDMMDRTELVALAATLASFDWQRSRLIVEIGAYLGTTTVFMAKVLELLGRSATILSIDPFERCQPDNLNPQGSYHDYVENTRLHGVDRRCLALAAFSEDAAAVVPGGIGVLVIDGSHHYAAVQADLALYPPKLAVGGYLFLDDYGPAYPDVVRATDEYLAVHPEMEIVVKSYYVILRRRA